MNVCFIKRLIAYVIDIFVISLLISIITINYSNSKIDDYYVEIDNIASDYFSGSIGMEEYLERFETVIYNIEKSSVVTNCIYLVIGIGYFVIFQYLNNGQTIGKKFMHIKIIDKNGMNVGLREIILRTCIINEILPNILSLILIIMCGERTFFLGYTMISVIENVFIFVSVVMVLYRSDNRGLHDIIAGTYVVDENNCEKRFA